MIDCHCHAIWGVDDGSQTEEMSLGMLQMAVECGTTDLICTPHVLNAGRDLNWPTILQKVDDLRELGAELELNWELVDLLKEGHRDYCLAGSRYVLLELPALTMPPWIDEFLFEMLVRGFRPVIAHPERHPKLMHHPDMLLKWMEREVLAQCNSGSFAGYFGRHVQANAELLLKHHMVTLIGSDAHRVVGRNTDMRKAVAHMKELAHRGYVHQITEENPRDIIADKPLYMNKLPLEIKPATINDHSGVLGFFNKFFGPKEG